VAVIPNGVDPSRFDGTDGADAAARTARRHRPPTVGFVGTFKPWHDLDTVVDVAAALADGRGESPRLLLVGDGPELARIRDRITALGLAETTETTGAVDADEIPGLLSRMDVALAPYTRDEQYFSPLKVFEYLAAGVAVVASRIDGLSGDLVDGREALVVEPGDRPSFVAAVQRLCTDRDLACALGRRGRAAARQRFCWDQTVDRILGAANAAAVA
jgi:glycosyltransferase involved in cell wall biosynthesis